MSLSSRHPAILLGLYTLLFAALAVAPVSRMTWALENALAVALVVGLVLTRRAFPFSGVSYTLIFVFLALHTLGAHYEYSNVPYDRWIGAVTGGSLNAWMGWERNHFDRMIHLAYGLLLVYPMREIFMRVADARGLWSYVLPLQMTMSTSLIYELIEWAAALVFGGDLGIAYLGTQGDEWDAQKDMALATLGATVTMLLVGLVNARLDRDFAAEWAHSLRVKRPAPLGEHRLRALLRAARRRRR
jgi:putative membrane protein